MALESQKFAREVPKRGPASLFCGSRALSCLGFALLLTASACSDDSDSSKHGSSDDSATADDDSTSGSSKKDAGMSKDAGASKDAGNSGGTMGADAGHLDASSIPSGGSESDGGQADGSDVTSETDSSVPSSANGACTREELKAVTDQYYEALATHDPSTLPLSDDVKFTENGKVLMLGEGLWKTAGMLKYKHSALDVDTCNSVSESVVPDGSMDIPLGLRLKLQDHKITEVETIAVRPGDYMVFGFSFPSDTNAIIASANRHWEDPISEDQRNTRADIEHWLTKYFKMFNMGGCNFAADCQRLENGGGSFQCSDAVSCSDGEPGPGPGTMTPRLIVVDVETGTGVGFTMFAGNTDFHMIKMYGGEIHAVHAILGAATSSGWD